MSNWLHSLCLLNDGLHWMLISADGGIHRTSDNGFANEEEALFDLRNFFRR